MYNILETREILKDFFDNFKDKLQNITTSKDRYDIFKFSVNRINKKIIEDFKIKYPNFLHKPSEIAFIFRCKNIDDYIQKRFCYCGKFITSFLNSKYNDHCSRKCLQNSPVIKEKKRKTNIKNSGVDHNFKRPDVKDKKIQTYLKNYGVDNPNKNRKIREKIEKTNMKHRGVKFPTQSKDVILLRCYNNNIKYKNGDFNRSHIDHFKDFNGEYILKHFTKDGFFLLDEFCEYFKCSKSYYYKNTKADFNIDIPVENNLSKTQNYIFNILQSLDVGVILNDRKILRPKELDLYLPDHNLAIEYDGLMFHSFGKSKHSMFNNYKSENKSKHLNKTEACEKQNIQLLHIFENEWLERPDLWKSVIKSKLGLNERFFARKCSIKEISNKYKSSFLINNHLQGDDKSSIRIGLYHQDILVSLMTFGKARYNKNYQYELLRFCSLQDLTIVGGASKLLKYFIKNYQPSSIISYANRRWSNGNLYRKIGFKEVNKTRPNYFYFKPDEYILHSRLKFQKHKLEKILDVFDSCLTESENMYNNGYRKIYDCGNYVFEYIF